LKLDYEVVDNFLPDDVFQKYSFLLGGLIPLFYSGSVSSEKDNKEYYLVHNFYDQDRVISQYFEDFISPLIWHEKVDIKALIRAKAGYYPKGKKIIENGQHTDRDYPHKNIVFYVNTCDGFTRLEDGTKVKSVANRALLLNDGLIKHNSTNSTNVDLRCTIAVNYF